MKTKRFYPKYFEACGLCDVEELRRKAFQLGYSSNMESHLHTECKYPEVIHFSKENNCCLDGETVLCMRTINKKLYYITEHEYMHCPYRIYDDED